MDVVIESYRLNENGAVAIYFERVTRSLNSVECVTFNSESEGSILIRFYIEFNGALKEVCKYKCAFLDEPLLHEKLTKHSLINIFEKKSLVGEGITYKAVAHHLVSSRLEGL